MQLQVRLRVTTGGQCDLPWYIHVICKQNLKHLHFVVFINNETRIKHLQKIVFFGLMPPVSTAMRKEVDLR